MSLYRQKKHDEAIRVFSRLATEHAGTAIAGRALVQSALCSLAKKDAEDARKTLQAVIRDSRYREVQDEALFELSRSWLATDQPDMARVFVNRLSEEFPQSQWTPEAVFRLGEYYFNKGMYESARLHFNEMVSRWAGNPLAGDALYWIGWTYAREGRTAMALGIFRSFTEKYPDNEYGGDARMRIAAMFAREGRSAEAVDAYMDIIKRYRGTETAELAAYEQGLVFEQRREYDKAVRNFQVLAENALSTTVKSRSMTRWGLWLIQHAKKEQEGIALLRRAAEADKGEAGAQARLEMGRLLYTRGAAARQMYAQAYDELMKIIYLHAEQKAIVVEALYLAADSLARQGNKNGALGLLDRLLREFPDGEWAIKARALKESL